VDQVFATYNSQLPKESDKLRTLYTAWYELLHDLEYLETKAAFLQLAINAAFMPRPGDIRRATINRRTKSSPFEEPLVAWGKWMTVTREVNSGTQASVQISDALKATIHELGDVAYGMHTNSDREAFCRTYERIVGEMDAQRYQIPELAKET
jgi:hypothetical protein